uniref:Pr1-like protein n=1 Tax=Oryza sativa subsp. japonica TaxID=39947 RepID=Q69KF0_ORYSJ|nr:pr1-like protein [Oryza sativa Japonica Group]BAD36590.1 pr1-like protein [Oryza sativa Japonica Group]
MVAGGGHRHGGAAAERGEGRGKRNGRSTAHPGSTATAETATGAEEGSGAARVDEDGGVPAVGDRNGEVDEVGEVAANPKKATPKREKVRGDDGGGPELGGDSGERGATARARFRRGERAASGGNGGGRHGDRLYRVGRGRERPDEGESAAEDPAAIDAPANNSSTPIPLHPSAANTSNRFTGIIQPTAPAVEPALPDFGVPNTLLALTAYVQDETAEHNTQGDSSHDDDDNLSHSLPPDELLTDSQPAAKIDQICIMEGAYHDSTEVNKEADDGARQHASPVKRCVKRAASAKATDIAASFKAGSMTEGIFIDAFASLLFKDEMRDNPETFGKKIFIPTSVTGLLNIENVTRVGSKDNFSPRALAEHLSKCLKGVNLSKAEQLLLPIINNDHWTLHIVYLNQGSFDILDSNDYDQIGGKESQHHYPLA